MTVRTFEIACCLKILRVIIPVNKKIKKRQRKNMKTYLKKLETCHNPFLKFATNGKLVIFLRVFTYSESESLKKYLILKSRKEYK